MRKHLNTLFCFHEFWLCREQRRLRMRKIIIALVALVVFANLAFAQELPAIKENYDCAGTSPNGEYTLSITIETKGENYFLSWQDGAMAGLGFRSDDKLVVAFVNRLTNSVGVVAYKVAENQLIGVWSGGGGKTYTESCLVGPKVKKGGKDGDKGPRVVARQAQISGL